MNKNLVLTLQPMPLPQATEHPNWGRFAEDRSHAVFCIVECLNRVGLTEWVPQFIKWLGKYDGLEMYADDEDDPQLCVRKIVRKNLAHFLKSTSIITAAVIKEKIVDEVLQQKFLFYRAHWGISRIPDCTSRIWKPLEQSWFSFIQLGTVKQDLHVWFSEKNPQPSLEEHRKYLLSEPV